MSLMVYGSLNWTLYNHLWESVDIYAIYTILDETMCVMYGIPVYCNPI